LEKVSWLKGKDIDSPALKRLNETLSADKPIIRGGRLCTEMLKDLREKMGALKLSETVFSSDIAVTASVLAQVWDAAIPNLIGRQLCVVVTKDAPTIKVPKAAAATVDWVAESGTLPITEERYSFVTITARKSGGRAVITRDMVEDAEWDVIDRQLAELGRALAKFESGYIISKLIEDAGIQAEAQTSGQLKFGDIASMWSRMAANDREPDVLAVNPSEYADLLKDPAVQNLIAFSAQEFKPGNPIAYLPGLKILVSSLVPQGTALMVATRFAGVLFVRRDYTIEEVDDAINDLVHLPATARWNYATIDPLAIGKITSA